jgi:GNAT superfamily N-acetyltransferase
VDPAPPTWRIRSARVGDAGAIVALVRELAAYEQEPDAVAASVEDFRRALFGPSPMVFCHVAEVDLPGQGPTVVGIAVWYVTFSTWRGRHGLWLEDLFVQPPYRGLGLGRALLSALARVAAERGYPRVEWWVLDWNEPAHHFYRTLGARAQSDWTVWRLSDQAVVAVADTAGQ